jgi:hypothetical protein
LALGQPCPSCGSVDVELITVEASADVPPLEVDVRVWNAVAFTLATVVYAALITVLGVCAAPLSWRWRVAYVLFASALFAIGLTAKNWVIRQCERLMGSPRI